MATTTTSSRSSCDHVTSHHQPSPSSATEGDVSSLDPSADSMEAEFSFYMEEDEEEKPNKETSSSGNGSSEIEHNTQSLSIHHASRIFFREISRSFNENDVLITTLDTTPAPASSSNIVCTTTRLNLPQAPHSASSNLTTPIPSSSNNNNQKHVQFHTIEVRAYPIILGDNPGGIFNGPPLTMDWHHVDCTSYTVSSFECSKEEKKTNRHLHSLAHGGGDAEVQRRPSSQRQDLLMKLGYSRSELQRASQEVAKIRRHRDKSQHELLFPRCVKETIVHSVQKVKKRLPCHHHHLHHQQRVHT